MGRGCLPGCLGGVLLVVVAVVLLGYFFVYQPARNFITQVQGYTAPFTGGSPVAADSTLAAQPLSQTEVQKFVRVRRAERTALGDSFAPLSKLGDQIKAGGNPSLPDMLNDFRQVGAKLGDARSAQQSAMEKEGLSAARYAAIRTQVNRALGVPEVNWTQVGKALQSLQAPDFSKAVTPPDARTVKLVAPFKRELTATAALGLLGL